MIHKKYYAIDIMRFISAIFVIYIHTLPLKNINYNLDFAVLSISKIAVPFFFVTSGYLFFNKVEKSEETGQVLFGYIKRIFTLYLIWSILNLQLALTNLKNLTVTKGIVIYLRNFIFVGSYFQLWYYPALIVGILLVFHFYKRTSIKTLLVLAMLMYVIGLFGNSYSILVPNSNLFSFVFDKYFSIFITTRNGLFESFIFVALGLLISKHKIKLNKRTNILFLIIFSIALIVESFMLKHNGVVRTFDICIMLVPVALLLVNFLVSLELKDRQIYMFFRNSSVLIFGIHKIFIEIFVSVLNKLGFNSGNISIVTFVLTIIVSILFSIIVLNLENKKGFRILKYLH